MDFSIYRALPAINWSSLKHMRDSALAYRYRLEAPVEDTPALALGRVTHALVFEPDTFERDYAIWEGGTRRGKDWEEFKAANEGRTIFKPEEIDRSIGMADAVRRHPLVQQYLVGGVFESTLTWRDEDTDLECKARPDWIIPDSKILLDLKTARSIDGRRFGAAAAAYGYHCQMAHYAAGVLAVHGWLPKRVLIVAVETDPPHDVAIFELDADAMWAGKEEVAELMERLRQCIVTDRWPGRYEDEQALQLPAWMFADDEDADADALGLSVEA